MTTEILDLICDPGARLLGATICDARVDLSVGPHIRGAMRIEDATVPFADIQAAVADLRARAWRAESERDDLMKAVSEIAKAVGYLPEPSPPDGENCCSGGCGDEGTAWLWLDPPAGERTHAGEEPRCAACLFEMRQSNNEIVIGFLTETCGRLAIAEAALERARHMHRTDPKDALDRATIQSVVEDDGFVHAADVLRLLDDVERAEVERDAACAERDARPDISRDDARLVVGGREHTNGNGLSFDGDKAAWAAFDRVDAALRAHVEGATRGEEG